MKSARTSLALLLLLAGLLASVPALAHHPHHRAAVRFGVFVGAPAFWYYPPPVVRYYHPYPPPVAAVPYSPPVYVERGDAAHARELPATHYWYYCPDEKAYHPYVRRCPGGWQRVVPQPPPG
jgi:hypothetical protein